MAMSIDPRFPDLIVRGTGKFENADGTDIKDVITAGSDGTRIDHMFISSNDSSVHDATLYLNDGVNDIWLGTLSVAAGSASGTVNRTAVNAMDNTKLTMLDGDLKLFMKAGDKIRASMDVAVTAACTVFVVAVGGDY